MSAHAFLSASGSSKWLKCPPSAKLESRFTDSGSEYAAEGTLAHELAELRLRIMLGQLSAEKADAQLAIIKGNKFYSPGMETYIESYTDIVMERFNEAKSRSADAYLLTEQRLDFSPWVPEGFGTGDVVIIAGNTIEVIDLKYGKGVPVSAENNSQTRLYGLGAFNDFGILYDFTEVKMTIIQPRLDSISSETLPLTKLLSWGASVKSTAEKAMRGEGEYSAGKHCRFCRAANTCRHLADYNLELAKYDFAEADLLSDDEISEILLRASTFTKWIKSMQDFALAAAVNEGKEWPGMKLVAGRSNRVITDPKALAEKLQQEGYAADAIYRPVELRTLTDLESLTGKKKFTELSNGLIDKPEGRPTLVSAEDKRPKWAADDALIAQF